MSKKYNPDDIVILLNGALCKYSKAIAFCHCDIHRGFITKALLSSHECLEKECSFFQRINPDYWEGLDRLERARTKRRNQVKIMKDYDAKSKKFIESVFKPFSNVYITSITLTNQLIEITYITNGFVDLGPAADALRRRFGCAVRLRYVRSSEEVRKQIFNKQ